MKKIIRAATVSMTSRFYVGLIPDLHKHGYEVVSVSSPGPELKLLSDQNVKCIDVPMERHISISKDIKSLIQLIRVFRQEKPDIVHSMTPKAGLLCMIAAKICHIPCRIHTFTGLVWPTSKGLKRKILMFTDWITCSCATHIIPEGQGVLNDLHENITKKPMRVLGYGNVCGVNITRFSRRKEIELMASAIRKDCFTFLFVGRLVGDKGINELVEAFVNLLNKNHKIRLMLVGWPENDLDPISELTMNRIKDIPEIEFVGQQEGENLVAYYAASDCFVMPSYREGFPNTVLEAGALGLPSIVTDINGSREIIRNEFNGLIVPPKDINALQMAMERVLCDTELTKLMTSNARPLVESRYEESFVRKCLLDFYDEALNQCQKP